MKTNRMNLIQKGMLTLLILLISMSLQAADKVEVAKNNRTSVVIEATETRQGDEVMIRNQRGDIIYREQLDASRTYKKIFQFSLFDNGVYIISFENDEKVTHYNVIKKNKGIKLIEVNKNLNGFEPIVKRNGEMAHIFFTNADLKDVELRITDDSGEILSSSNFDEELIIKRSYDLSRLPSGKYSLRINVGEQSFTNILNVQ